MEADQIIFEDISQRSRRVLCPFVVRIIQNKQNLEVLVPPITLIEISTDCVGFQ